MRKTLDLNKNRRGFTLVEAVAAIMIVVIVLLVFLELCSLSMITVKKIRHKLCAINIARAEIEDVRALGYGGMTVGTTDTNVTIDEGLITDSSDDITGTITTIIKNTTSGPSNGRKVIVQIAWTASGTAMQETLETVVYTHQ